MEERPLITNVQRFSLHDGPGIRTTVFCKGCPLRCPWCANPETQKSCIEEYVKDGKKGKYGRYITCGELFEEVMKDELFYGQLTQEEGMGKMPGGITLSGGEPLMQTEKMEGFLQRLKDKSIHVCVETSLFVSDVMLRLALEYINLFYVDIKIMDEDNCKAILGGEIQQYLSNMEILYESGTPYIFRVPVIGGYTDTENNKKAIIEFIRKYPPIKVELLKEHNLGSNKYLSLERQPLELNSVTDAFMEKYKYMIEAETGMETKICKI